MRKDYEAERKRLTKLAFENPRPCLICGSKEIVGVGTWIPDKYTRLAAGGNKKTIPVFAYCLCEEHAEDSKQNHTIIRQQIIREVREGKGLEA